MEIVLFVSAWLAFSLSPALAPLALRCGLCACLRFSPRASVALSSVAALAGYLGALLARGGLRAVPPGQRFPVAMSGVTGGTVGRMLLLMFVARFSGSLALARLQAALLLLLSLIALLPSKLQRIPLPRTRAGLYVLAMLSAAAEGHFGCGALALWRPVSPGGVRRRSDSPMAAVLLLGALAQASALLLTLLSGGAQVFPARMPASLFFGAALGGWRFEQNKPACCRRHHRQTTVNPVTLRSRPKPCQKDFHNKKRGEVRRGLRIALGVYVLLAALAGAEQAYLH